MIKILLTISFLFSLAYGQYTYKYATTTDQYGASFNYLVYMPNDSGNGIKRPTLIYLPGSGETGGSNNTLVKANTFGVTRQVAAGLISGTVLQNGSPIYPIRIVIQRATSTNRDTLNYANIKKVIDLYINYIDTFQLHLSGVSLGGINIGYLLVNLNNRGTSNYRFATMFMCSPGGADANVVNNRANFANYATAGGHMLMLTGNTDGTAYQVNSGWLSPMNNVVPGSAVGRNWTSTDNPQGTGHCCWGPIFDQSTTWDVCGGKSYEEWALQYNRGSAPVAPVQKSIFKYPSRGRIKLGS